MDEESFLQNKIDVDFSTETLFERNIKTNYDENHNIKANYDENHNITLIRARDISKSLTKSEPNVHHSKIKFEVFVISKKEFSVQVYVPFVVGKILAR